AGDEYGILGHVCSRWLAKRMATGFRADAPPARSPINGPIIVRLEPFEKHPPRRVRCADHHAAPSGGTHRSVSVRAGNRRMPDAMRWLFASPCYRTLTPPLTKGGMGGSYPHPRRVLC